MILCHLGRVSAGGEQTFARLNLITLDPNSPMAERDGVRVV